MWDSKGSKYTSLIVRVPLKLSSRAELWRRLRRRNSSFRMRRRIRTSRKTRASWWFWSGVIGLALVGVVLFVFSYTSSRSSFTASSIAPSPSVSELRVTDSLVPTEVFQVAEKIEPTLPPLDFPPGSVEKACGLNDFPPYHYREEDGSRPANTPFNTEQNLIYLKSQGDKLTAYTLFNPERDWLPLESDECRSALEKHINDINPYLWGATYENRPFAFVMLDKPLTFERIFSDPMGDLARIQDALSCPECLLEDAETNWELKESCNAEAFLNYALINRFCYEPYWPDDPQQQLEIPRDGVSRRSRTNYWERDNPTPEQDRFMWKQTLEDDWIRRKCVALGSSLAFTPEQYPVLHELVTSFGDSPKRKKNVRELLIEQAARLGDDAAGLTQSFYKELSHSYSEEGYKYGRFAELLTSTEWQNFYWKNEPSVDRFLRTFHLLSRLGSRGGDDRRDVIQFDWEFVARHLCAPPYFKHSRGRVVQVENVEHPSCIEIVHEIRQKGITFPPLLDKLDKFEQVALELEVYEWARAGLGTQAVSECHDLRSVEVEDRDSVLVPQQWLMRRNWWGYTASTSPGYWK